MPTSTILSSLKNRAEQNEILTQLEYETAWNEVEALPNPVVRDYYIRQIEQLKPTSVDSVAFNNRRRSLFQHRDFSQNGLLAIGRDYRGVSIPSDEFRYTFINLGDNKVPLSKTFSALALKIYQSPEYQTENYFSGASTAAQKLLALATIVMDFSNTPEALGALTKQTYTSEQLNLFAWELLARIDAELGGMTEEADLRRAIAGAPHRLEQYKALKAYIELAGLHPMSARALSIRDGRERAVGVFAGQGANYLDELAELIAIPEVGKLYEELKPIFLKHNIDVDYLLKNKDMDQDVLENYFAINRVKNSFGLINLVQVLRERSLELSGFDMRYFAGEIAQSGGQLAAYFAAGAFDPKGYERPLMPRHDGEYRGYHLLSTYKNFLELSIAVGEVFEEPYKPAYEAGEKWEDLVKKEGDKIILPSPQEITAYFKKFHIVNMTTWGVPFDSQNPKNNTMGKLMSAITTKLDAEVGGENRLLVSNRTTGPTPNGRNSHQLLVIGTPKALEELYKLLTLKKAEGYPHEIQRLVAAFADDPIIRPPVLKTRVTLAPHDPVVYGNAPEKVLEKLAQAGIIFDNTQLITHVLNNFSGEIEGRDQLGHVDSALEQNFHLLVDMPRVIGGAAETLKATSFYIMGPGKAHEAVIAAALTPEERTHVDVVSVMGKDAEQVVTTNPVLAFAKRPLTDEEEDQKAIDAMAQVKGVRVQEKSGDETKDSQRITQVSFSDSIPDDKQETFWNLLKELGDGSPLAELLTTVEKIKEGNQKLDNNLRSVIKIASGLTVEFTQDELGWLTKVSISERGGRSLLELSWDHSAIPTRVVIRQVQGKTSNAPITDKDKIVSLTKTYVQDAETGEWSQENIAQFRSEGRALYRDIWFLSEGGERFAVNLPADHVYHTEEIVDAAEVANFAGEQLQLRSAQNTDVRDRNFEVLDHYLSQDEWMVSMAPSLTDQWDMDFTKLYHESQTIQWGAERKVGDRLINRAQLLKVEDFAGGRRVVVFMEQVKVLPDGKQVMTKRTISSMVSRIPTGVPPGEVVERYRNKALSEKLDYFEGRQVFNLKPNLQQEIDTLALDKALEILGPQAEEAKKKAEEGARNRALVGGQKPTILPPVFDEEKINEAYKKFLEENKTEIENTKLQKNEDLKKAALEKLAGKLVDAYKKLGTDAVQALRLRRAFMPSSPLVAKINIQLPEVSRLTETYNLDPNPIHISNAAAAQAGFTKGAIMQGMATLAYVNTLVVKALQKQGIIRKLKGVANVKFEDALSSTQEVDVEIRQTAVAEGLHQYEVIVKDAKTGKRVMSYDQFAEGPKTAFLFTGQGSQYEGMGNHLLNTRASREKLESYQKLIPTLAEFSFAYLALIKPNGKGKKGVHVFEFNESVDSAHSSKQLLLIRKVLSEAIFKLDAAVRADKREEGLAAFNQTLESEVKPYLTEANYEKLLQAFAAIEVKEANRKPVLNLVEVMNKASRDTSEAQPMITAYSLILFYDVLKARGLVPQDASFVGHSLGEWIALVAAGVIKPEDAMQAIYQRGFAMQSYNDPENPQGLMLVRPKKRADGKTITLTQAHVEALQTYLDNTINRGRGANRLVLEFSNDNMPEQVMLGGHVEAITNPGLLRLLGEFGFEGSLFKGVENAFHTSIMGEASEDFGKWMEEYGNPFTNPEAANIYLDTYGKTLRQVADESFGGDLKKALATVMMRQISSSVKWRDTIRRMLLDGHTLFKEVGPRSVLASFVKAELAYLVKEKIISPDTRIEVQYFNPFVSDVKATSIAIFTAREAVLELKLNRVVPGAAKPANTNQPKASAAPVEQKPLPTQPSVEVSVDAGMVRTAIDGFVVANKARLDKGDGDALVPDLVKKLKEFGPGARNALQEILASLPVVGGGASAGGNNVESMVIDVLKTFTSVKSILTKHTITDDLDIKTSDTGGLVSALNSKLGVSFSDGEIKDVKTVAELIKLATSKKGGQAGAAAAKGPSAEDVLKRKALEIVVAELQGSAPAPTAAFQPSVAVVSNEDVAKAIDGFMASNKALVEKGEGVSQLAQGLVALGAGARQALQARLAKLSPTANNAPAAAAGATTSLPDVQAILEKLGYRQAKPTDSLTDKLGMSSTNINDLNSSIAEKFKVNFSKDELDGMKTVKDIADALDKRGAKGSAAAPAVVQVLLSLTPAQMVEKSAIEQALADPAMQVQSGAPIDNSVLLQLRNEVDQLRKMVEALQAGPSLASPAPVVRMMVDQDGNLVEEVTALQQERDVLRKKVENIEKQLSPWYVANLTTPHYHEFLSDNQGVTVDGTNYTFNPDDVAAKSLKEVEKEVALFRLYVMAYNYREVTQNGGPQNLAAFYAWVRSKEFEEYIAFINQKVPAEAMERQPAEQAQELSDRINRIGKEIASRKDEVERNINRLANQVDEIRLEWLERWISVQEKNGTPERVAILKDLAQKVRTRLAKKGLITQKIVSIQAGNHVVDGSPNHSHYVPDERGTLAIAEDLTNPAHADPTVKPHMDAYLDNGADLRGRKVLVNQAGTITTPYIQQFLGQGANVLLTDYAQRSSFRNGRTNADIYYDLYNDNAADGSNLDVLPSFQPGNRQDENTLLRFIELQFLKEKKAYEAYEEEEKNLAKVGKAPTREKPPRPQLPTVYMNGSAYASYGSLLSRGNQIDAIEVMARSTKDITLGLVALHTKYNTGQQVVLVNYWTPNSNKNIATYPGEVIGSGIKDSKDYPWAKLALPPGSVVAQAEVDGLKWEDGSLKVVQLDYEEGWGKSGGEKVTIMSGNDAFSLTLEELAQLKNIDLKTLTGSQLATEGMATLIAVLTGKLKGASYYFDHTHGFRVALERKEFNELMKKAKELTDTKSEAMKKDWEKAQKSKEFDPSELPYDGSLVNLNETHAVIADGSDPAYQAKEDDIILDDETDVVVGYGAVGPLGQDALTNYRGMLARGMFKGREGFAWLGEYDFYNLARSMGLDVTDWKNNEKWKYEEAAKLLSEEPKGRNETWKTAFQNRLVERSGLQEIEKFKQFEVWREVSFKDDVEVNAESLDADIRKKMQLAGAVFTKRGNVTYAQLKAGITYRLPFKVRLAAVVGGDLPGQNDFDFEHFGIPAKELRTGAKAAFMAKMFTAQMIMSMGGYSPQELTKVFGAKNMFVAIGTGLGDLDPFNEMTVNPVLGKPVANYLMAALLPDASAGQVATEMLGAEGMALAVVAACSTGNAALVTAHKLAFEEYYRYHKEVGDVDWQKVFTRVWFAGGVDYALTFNAVFGFDAIPATLREDFRKSWDYYVKAVSRPDESGRGGFILGAGGGAQAKVHLKIAKELGLTAYGAIFGADFHTDGYERGKAREGYGRGQAQALFTAWDQAKDKVTKIKYSTDQIESKLKEIIASLGSGTYDPNRTIDHIGLTLTQQKTFRNKISEAFGLPLPEKDGNYSFYKQTLEELVGLIQDKTRVLNPRIRVTVLAHKTATPAGDPLEENNLRTFLSTILGQGQYAHIIKTKGDLGHLLGGSSGMDAALTPLFLRYGIAPGTANMDVISAEAGQNGLIFHHKHAIDLNEIYEDDAIDLVIRESAGFNAKNAAVVEVKGKVSFKDKTELIDYKRKQIERTMRERLQKRAERLGLRTMAFEFESFPDLPLALFRDIYEVSIRSQAIAEYIVNKRGTLKFDTEKDILSWVYRFDVNAEVALKKKDESQNQAFIQPRKAKSYDRTQEQADAFNKKYNDQIRLNQHNAIKYREAELQIKQIIDEINPDDLKIIAEKAREKKLDKQTVVFWGGSDGMNLRFLVTLMVSGVLKEVVMIHRDGDPTRGIEHKASAFTPEILKGLAKRYGVNMTVLNTNGVLFRTRDEKAKDAAGNDVTLKGDGTPLPLPDDAKRAIKAHLQKSELKSVSVFDGVAFGAPIRPHNAENPENPVFPDRPEELWVPSITAKGELELRLVEKAKSPEQERLSTILAMGENHPRLLELFKAEGWLTQDSLTGFFDWRGSETKILLPQIYGGESPTTRGVLGNAKLVTKNKLDEEWPGGETGKHVIFGFPAFLSFALHQIPGGTLLGLIEKRVFEDIQNGTITEVNGHAIPPELKADLRFKSMTSLAVEALKKCMLDMFEGKHNNRINVDEHERFVYTLLASRMNEVFERMMSRLKDKRSYFFAQNPNAKPEDFKWKLSPEETKELLADLLPDDADIYTHQHIEDLDQRLRTSQAAEFEKNGAPALALPGDSLSPHTYDKKVPVEDLRAYPFIQPAYSPSLNTPQLAVEVIDAGGVGTLDAGNLKAYESEGEKAYRLAQAKRSGKLSQNPDTLLARIMEIYRDEGGVPEGSPLMVNLLLGNEEFENQLKLLTTVKEVNKTLGIDFTNEELGKFLSTLSLRFAQPAQRLKAIDRFMALIRPTVVSLSGGLADFKTIQALQEAKIKVFQTLDSASDADYIINATRRASTDEIAVFEDILKQVDISDQTLEVLRNRIKNELNKGSIALTRKELGDFANQKRELTFEKLKELLQYEIDREAVKVDGVILSRSVGAGPINLAGNRPLDVNSLQSLMEVEPIRGERFPLGSNPGFVPPRFEQPLHLAAGELVKATFELDHLPESYAGFSGITHGGTIDGLFEAAFDAMNLGLGSRAIAASEVKRVVNYIKPATTLNNKVRIVVDFDAKKKIYSMTLEGEEEVTFSDGKKKKAWIKWDTATYSAIAGSKNLEREKSVLKPDEIDREGFKADYQFSCTPSCCAAGHENATGLGIKYSYDESQKAIRAVVTAQDGINPYNQVMLAGDDLVVWSGFFASKMWGYSSDNKYTPFAPLPTQGPIFIESKVPEYNRLKAGTFAVKASVRDQDGNLLGILTATYYLSEDPSIKGLTKMLESLRANPEDQEIRQTFAMMKMILGSNFERLLKAADQKRDVGADPEQIVSIARLKLDALEIPVIARGGYTSEEEVKKAFHDGASAVMPDGIFFAGSQGAQALQRVKGQHSSTHVDVAIVYDADGKAYRVLNTPGVDAYNHEVEALKKTIKPDGSNAEFVRQQIAQLFYTVLNGVDINTKLYPAPAKLGEVDEHEKMPELFRKLLGFKPKPRGGSTPTPTTPSDDPLSGVANGADVGPALAPQVPEAPAVIMSPPVTSQRHLSQRQEVVISNEWEDFISEAVDYVYSSIPLWTCAESDKIILREYFNDLVDVNNQNRNQMIADLMESYGNRAFNSQVLVEMVAQQMGITITRDQAEHVRTQWQYIAPTPGLGSSLFRAPIQTPVVPRGK